MFDRVWLDRVDLERRNRNISGDQARVLDVLGRLALQGDTEPSEARLASEAGVSRSTVTRAKRAGKRLGLLEWERQPVYAGNLRRDKPCAYQTMLPPAPCVRRMHQGDGRPVSSRIGSGQVRSVAQQLALLPVVTEAHRALVAERMARVAGRCQM